MTQISQVSACDKCPGFCCKLFFIPTSPEEMRKRLEEKSKEFRMLCDKMSGGLRLEHSVIRRFSELIQNLEMLSFGVMHFKHVPDVRSDKTGKIMGNGEGFPYGQYSYTCDQWDPDTGRCLAYFQRPWTCQSYVCEVAMEGGVPTRENFPYSAQLTDEQAKEILDFRNQPFVEEACIGKDEDEKEDEERPEAVQDHDRVGRDQSA